ncbi:MFS transporter [Crocinitomicaceae bacterium]|nr:MFS transporter [Crocinitomicaceae bacterium]MDC0257252.1 MFS transporter [Crocinitomicaceae bacterium]
MAEVIDELKNNEQKGSEPKGTNYGALTTLTTVFFFWGFIAAGNSVFIPFCKSYFGLDQFQSQLVDFAFYGAYYLGALGLYIFGSASGRDLVGSWGYKKSIVFGLLFSAIGAAAMIVSVYMNVFAGMLLGLFIVALGFSLQQTSANPFMISLGDEATGSNRINLGGGINSLGTTIGPLVVSLALFGSAAAIDDDAIEALSLSKVIILYAFVGVLFLGIAALFGFSKKVPAGINEEKTEKSGKALVTLLVITGLLIACFAPVFASYASKDQKEITAIQKELDEVNEKVDKDFEAYQATFESEALAERLGMTKEEFSKDETEFNATMQMTVDHKTKILEERRMIWLTLGLAVILIGLLFASIRGAKTKVGWGAMQYPQLTLGMLAIFVYVGVEVAVGSNLSELLNQKEFGGLEASEVAPYVAMFWGSLMIGRWAGAINAFKMKDQTKMILRFFVPLVAFGVVLGLSKLSGYDIDALYWYILCVLVQIGAFYVTNDKPALTLAVFGGLGIVAMGIGLSTTGLVAVYAFLSAGLCCSIMWPCIFSLSIAGLGKYQTQGSAFLVMMILGGGIIPPIQGKLSDIIGIQPSFIVGLMCFAYLTFFALYVRRILRIQKVDFE